MDISVNLTKFRDTTQHAFGENLMGILIYGSTMRITKPHDVDILVILKQKKDAITDLDILKKILPTIDNRPDMQLVYSDEIGNGNTFSLDTHGPFIIEQLKRALVLYGLNPFVGIEIISEIRSASVLQKLQYYTFRARQEFLGYLVISKDRNKDFHRKKILFAMQDLLIAQTREGIDPVTVITRFSEVFPGVLKSSELERIVTDTEVLNIREALPYYECLYNQALVMVQDIIHESPKPGWCKIGDIFCEFLLPFPDSSNIPSIILCEGLPSQPSQRVLMDTLANHGFAVFFPRYRGTWESGGVFLNESPVKDIESVAIALRNGIVLGKHVFVSGDISLMGTSFGGSVALCSAKSIKAHKIVALSPVPDFKTLPGLSSLRDFLQSMFTGAYRFNNNGWQALLAGELLNPSQALADVDANRILIIGGENDNQITPYILKTFATSHNIQCVIQSKTPHISFSKTRDNILDNILKFMLN